MPITLRATHSAEMIWILEGNYDTKLHATLQGPARLDSTALHKGPSRQQQRTYSTDKTDSLTIQEPITKHTPTTRNKSTRIMPPASQSVNYGVTHPRT